MNPTPNPFSALREGTMMYFITAESAVNQDKSISLNCLMVMPRLILTLPGANFLKGGHRYENYS